jgi:phenylalanyl-tRNA synthetase beta chain
MLFSRNWLAQYVDLPGSVEELARRLTAAGLAVEGLETRGDDVILDVDVTSNRPDCMCHLGLAREVAVVTGAPLRPPPVELAESAEPAAAAIRVVIDDAEGCPRYVARVVRGITVAPSPAWLQERLAAIGLRPINNVVDVTNYVLWETGQPLHAFDLSRLEGAEIRVRRAHGGESLTTLDGQPRELTAGMLVITDAHRPIALAGVMGGEDTEVTAATRDVLLEGAHFERRTVRRSARALALHTDASHRFERGADPDACRPAVDRAAALLAELAGGTVLASAVEAQGRSLPPCRGRLSHRALEAFAGFPVAREEVEATLAGLGFELEALGEGEWRVTVPSWRWYDFEPRREPPHELYPADLYEEVLRIGGFDRVPATLPAVPGSDGPVTAVQGRRRRLREVLVGCGFAEAIHYAFHDRVADARFPSLAEGVAVAITNPLSERYEVLRRSLVPNLLASARFNLRRGAAAVRLFEIGHVFAQGPAGTVDERETVVLLCGGTVGTPWARAVPLDFFDLKGVVEEVGEALLGRGTRLQAEPAALPGVVAGTGAWLSAAGRPLGWMGQLDDPETGEALFAAELETGRLAVAEPRLQVEVPSRYPGVAADLTLTHRLDLPWAAIAAEIEASPPADLASFGLKDRYRGAGVPVGAVNTTIQFLYGSSERSLTQEEVNERQGALARRLEERFGVATSGDAG